MIEEDKNLEEEIVDNRWKDLDDSNTNLLFHYLLKIILQIFWNLSLYHWSSTILSASILWGSSSISNSLSYGSLLTNHDRDNSQIKYEWKVIEGRILLKKSRIWQESWAQTISWRYKIHWLFIKSYERRWTTSNKEEDPWEINPLSGPNINWRNIRDNL